MTRIEWSEKTWNPLVGCSIRSPGCTNCYAMQMAARIERMNPSLAHYKGLTQPSKAGPVWTGKLALAPETTLLAPVRRRKPTMWFVNSMSDLFHEDVPDEWIDRVFAVMALCPQHTFQVLTKRSARMRRYLSDVSSSQIGSGGLHLRIAQQMEWVGFDAAPSRVRAFMPFRNVWLGVSCERQQEADERIPDLLATPAAVRFVSAEPLLGPIDFRSIPTACLAVHGACCGDQAKLNALGGYQWCQRGGAYGFPRKDHIPRGLNWIVVGGESGPNARPMHPDWARSIRDQCAEAGVPFFFKQWGEWKPHKVEPGGDLGGDVRADRVRIVHPSGRTHVEVFAATGGRNTELGSSYMSRVGKSSAGRLLDGREHSDMPRPAHA